SEVETSGGRRGGGEKERGSTDGPRSPDGQMSRLLLLQAGVRSVGVRAPPQCLPGRLIQDGR
ncbi:hypothetical protein V5799_013139, partial [Amblyomma americanum]